MKKTYETPSLQIERFDLQDPDILTNWISETGGSVVVDPDEGIGIISEMPF